MTSTSSDDQRDLVRGVSINVLTWIVAATRALYPLLIARAFGAEALGIYALAVAAIDIASHIGFFGLDIALTVIVARQVATGNHGAVAPTFRRSVWLAAAVGGLVAAGIIAFWAAGRSTAGTARQAVALLSLAIPAIAIWKVCIAITRGLRVMTLDLYTRGLIEMSVATIVLVTLLPAGRSPLLPVAASLAGTTASAICAFLLTSRLVRRLDAPQGDGPSWSQLIRAGLPIGTSNLLNLLTQRLDVLLLGSFVGRVPGVTPASFGVFCGAVEIAAVLRKSRQVVDPVLTPIVTGVLTRGNPQAIASMMARPWRWILLTQFGLMGVLALGRDDWLRLYGLDGGGTWLVILVAAHGVNGAVGLAETLITIERPNLNTINAAVTLVVQAAVGLVLITRLGISGAAVAMLIAYLLRGLLSFAEMPLLGREWPWHILPRPLAAFVSAGAASVFLRAFLNGPSADLLSAAVFLALFSLAASVRASPEMGGRS